jgi:hypothetical protein
MHPDFPTSATSIQQVAPIKNEPSPDTEFNSASAGVACNAGKLSRGQLDGGGGNMSFEVLEEVEESPFHTRIRPQLDQKRSRYSSLLIPSLSLFTQLPPLRREGGIRGLGNSIYAAMPSPRGARGALESGITSRGDTKEKWKVENDSGSKVAQQLGYSTQVQVRGPGNFGHVHPTRGLNRHAGPQRRVLARPNPGKSPGLAGDRVEGSVLRVPHPAVRPQPGSVRVHQGDALRGSRTETEGSEVSGLHGRPDTASLVSGGMVEGKKIDVGSAVGVGPQCELGKERLSSSSEERMAGNGNRRNGRARTVSHPSKETARDPTRVRATCEEGRIGTSPSSPRGASGGLVRIGYASGGSRTPPPAQRTPLPGRKSVMGGLGTPLSPSPGGSALVEGRSTPLEWKARSPLPSGLGNIHRRSATRLGSASGGEKSERNIPSPSPTRKLESERTDGHPSGSKGISATPAGKIALGEERQRHGGGVRESTRRTLRPPVRYSPSDYEPLLGELDRDLSSSHSRGVERTRRRVKSNVGSRGLDDHQRAVPGIGGKVGTPHSRQVRNEEPVSGATLQQSLVGGGNRRRGCPSSKLARGEQLGSPPIPTHQESGDEAGGATGGSDSDSSILGSPRMVSLFEKEGGGSADALP